MEKIYEYESKGIYYVISRDFGWVAYQNTSAFFNKAPNLTDIYNCVLWKCAYMETLKKSIHL